MAGGYCMQLSVYECACSKPANSKIHQRKYWHVHYVRWNKKKEGYTHNIQLCKDLSGVENFDEISLSQTVKEIEAFLCFCIFGENSKIQNDRHFWKEEHLWNLSWVYCLDTLWGENFDEIAPSLTVKEIKAFLCKKATWPYVPRPAMALAVLGSDIEGQSFLCLQRT